VLYQLSYPSASAEHETEIERFPDRLAASIIKKSGAL
jgi:hypothetical protein